MKILAFDTALNAVSVAVADTVAGVIHEKIQPLAYGQAEHLVPMVDEILREAGWSYHDLERIGVTHGPGAFTGMRVGIATARALSLSLGIPAVGLSTFEAVLGTYLQGSQVKPAPFFGVLLDTRRNDFYFQAFAKNAAGLLSDGQVLDRDAVEKQVNTLEGLLLVGDALERYGAEGVEIKHIAPRVLVEMTENAAVTGENVRPLYIRPPDVTLPKSSVV